MGRPNPAPTFIAKSHCPMHEQIVALFLTSYATLEIPFEPGSETMLVGRNYLQKFDLRLQMQKPLLIARKPARLLRFAFAEMLNLIAENAQWRKCFIGAPTPIPLSFLPNPLSILRFAFAQTWNLIAEIAQWRKTIPTPAQNHLPFRCRNLFAGGNGKRRSASPQNPASTAIQHCRNRNIICRPLAELSPAAKANRARISPPKPRHYCLSASAARQPTLRTRQV